MRLSTKAQYAVRAMVSLNLTLGESPVSIREISEREGISLSYLEQLFVKLRRGKIVNSVRGPGGGYVLARNADLIRVDQIIDSAKGDVGIITDPGTPQNGEEIKRDPGRKKSPERFVKSHGVRWLNRPVCLDGCGATEETTVCRRGWFCRRAGFFCFFALFAH